MTGTSGPEPALRADAARNRARVLRAAREQVAAGAEALQLNAVARLAGVGVGTVYRHFPTPHALWEALSAERFQELVDEARAAADDEDALAGLHRLLRFTLARALEDTGFAAVLASAGDAEARTSELKNELDASVARLLDRARRTGAVRRDVEADDVRRLLCGIEHAVRSGGGGSGSGGGSGVGGGGGSGGPARAELYLGVLLEGLRPPR
ncbi:TetR/AcrR family transcriptional regulator [Streptomyces clavuligerus]|uniref:TetR/AcrR family transcriptional regulator n=1 Tax=Streptomyces clavuligerus TaxID=1901 RepID=UPI0018D039DF|nr:helix-turn-helix domain-containing protein [Streptomyces clavuligerus]